MWIEYQETLENIAVPRLIIDLTSQSQKTQRHRIFIETWGQRGQEEPAVREPEEQLYQLNSPSSLQSSVSAHTCLSPSTPGAGEPVHRFPTGQSASWEISVGGSMWRWYPESWMEDAQFSCFPRENCFTFINMLTGVHWDAPGAASIGQQLTPKFMWLQHIHWACQGKCFEKCFFVGRFEDSVYQTNERQRSTVI